MERSDKKRLIVVLGMHRSGTSALTKSLEVMGVGLGSDIMPVKQDNPKGFWEDMGCVKINQALLGYLNSHVDGFDFKWDNFKRDAQVSDLLLRATQLMSSRLSENNGVWGFKDPRTCRLLFFWNEVFSALDCEVDFVIAVRNPASVAASLTDRNGLAMEKSYFLWLQYVLLSLAYTKGKRRVVVDYDNLLENPYKQLTRMSEALGFAKPERRNPMVKEYVSSFLEKGLRHTRFSEAELALDSRASGLVLRTYRLLHRLANDQDTLESQTIQAELDELLERLNEFSPAFDYIHALEHGVTERDGQIAGLSQAVSERDGQIAGLTQAVSERDGQIAGLSQAVSERDGQIAGLNQAVSERDGQIAGLSQAVSERDGQIAGLNRAMSERDSQIAELNRAVSERDGQIAGLNQAVSERGGQIVGMSQAVMDRDDQIASLNQAVTERDGQIASLNQAVTERDGQIADLNQAATERDIRISVMLQSRSWRLTRSLRRLFGRMPLLWQARIRRIRQSPLFDADFYAERNPDVVAAGVDLAKHYALSGWKEYRNPSAEFSTRRYLEANPDVVAADINPLLHYIDQGQAEGRQIYPVEEEAQIEAIRASGLFDADYYLATYTDIQPQPQDPIRHYCERGWREGRSPSADFDTQGYLAAYNDVKAAGVNPFWHYVFLGQYESRHANPEQERKRRIEAEVEAIRASGLFDTDFYADRNPDVVASGVDLAKHYALSGWKEHRNPSAEFSTRRYLETNPDVAIAGINPLLHYIDKGKAEGRQIHFVEEEAIRASGLFDTDFYAERNPDVVAAGVDLAKHYALSGWKEHRNPSAEFSTLRYLEANLDVAIAGINPLLHYIEQGQAEGRQIYPVEEEAQIKAIRASGLFDDNYYFATYPDIQPPIDPIRHYCERGWREGRNPSAEFDTQGYLAAYRDVKDAGVNPFWHYVVAGRYESRHANPEQERKRRIEAEVEAIRASGLFDTDFYAKRNPDVVAAGVDLVKHYTLSGWNEHRNPSAGFSTRRYLDANPDVAATGINPLLHYIDRGQAEGRQIYQAEEEEQIEAVRDSGLFDADYYLATYPDIQPPPKDPVRHYCYYGWREGRNPSKEFNTQGYLAAYNDVKDAGINPLWHYVVLGRYESRFADPERGKRIEVEEEAIPAAADIAIATSDNPLVSIIIPIYGKVDYTLRCLASIAKHLPEVAIEVIIVDDCSPDDSLDVLSEVKGIRLLRNKQNQGFIRSCNKGAKAAKGQYLYFLNNDTKVTEGWLDALLRTFIDFPGTGLAGSKLVYPDGRLQEAGGIIWQDGSAWNFGRFQNPHLPVYNYAREVDYCSGASIMVPKSLFEELGGFDEHYSPAYCEDSDLALKIRDKGYRVIYQPLSTVIHYEGITSGTDITQGTKAYQVVNSKKQFVRWQQRLSTHQAPGCDVDNAKDRKSTRRVLFLDHCTPTPNQDSGSIDAYNQMLLMREMGFQVTFIPEDNFLYMPDYTSDLQCKGIEMLYAPYVMSVEQHVKEHGDRYDLVFISRPGAFNRNINLIRKYCRKAKVLFHTVDLHFLRMGREADLLKSNELNRTAAEMKKRELAYIAAADVSTVVSVEELAVVQRHLPDAKVKLLPFSRAIRGTKSSFSERANISFVGGYQHPPNVDAVQYFVKDVMPLLRKQLPGVRFYAVGSKTPAEIQALASEDVIITGFVEDLDSLLDKMRVSVAPLRYGAGIKGKIGTAMAVGLPVVATSLATEGMSLTDGENILVADGAEALAETLARIYQDESLWNRISKNGLSFAEEAWGAESAWEILAAILADIGIQVKRRAYPLSLYSPSR